MELVEKLSSFMFYVVGPATEREKIKFRGLFDYLKFYPKCHILSFILNLY